jgi:hypothetical protein
MTADKPSPSGLANMSPALSGWLKAPVAPEPLCMIYGGAIASGLAPQVLVD